MTTLVQRLVDNDDERFPGQVLIVGEVDGVEVWRSWAPAALDPAVRLNADQPVATDDRTDTPPGKITYRVPDVDEYLAMTSIRRRDYDAADADEPGKDHHRVLAAYAAAVAAVTVEAAADAVGLTTKGLVDEAEAWAVAAERGKHSTP